MATEKRKAFTWTEERLDALRRMSAEGLNAAACAEKLSTKNAPCNVYAVQNARTRYSIRTSKKVEPQAGIKEVLELPPKTFAVGVPTIATPSKSKTGLTAVVYGDSHFPFQDDSALNLVKYVIKDTKPDFVLHTGDLVDCWQISRFDKDPSRRDTLQDNIDEAAAHLGEIAALAPQAKRVLLEGNHEARLTAAIWRLDGAQREFAKLRVFQDTLTWPRLLDLEKIGFQWVGVREQSRTPILPKIITKHGDRVCKWSGGSAKAEWEKYGHSGLSGHTHRLGQFFHQDHNGTATWTEMGCTCQLQAPYGTDFDWQQGFGVLRWSPDLKVLHTELLSIRDGQTIWNKQVIEG